MRLLLRAAGALAIVTLAASPAAATIVRSVALEDLASGSAVIVHAQVSQADETDPAYPFQTVIELEVVETIKGLTPTTRTLTLVLPGGRKGPLASFIPGLPRLDVGDEVVLLLEATPTGGYIPSGLAQGVFRVDRTGAVPMARRELHGATYVDATGAETAVPTVPERLDELESRLRALSARAVQK